MTPEEIGNRVMAVLIGGLGALGAARIRAKHKGPRIDPEHPLFADVRSLRAEFDEHVKEVAGTHAERLTILETDYKNLVRRMEEHDERAARERVEILSAIEGMGNRLEKKLDTLTERVYDRRGHS